MMSRLNICQQVLPVAVLACALLSGPSLAAPPIESLGSKDSRTAVERKLATPLIATLRVRDAARSGASVESVPSFVQSFIDANVTVDESVFVVIKGQVSDDLVGAISSLGARDISPFPQYDTVTAVVPVAALAAIAQRGDVRSIGARERARTHRYMTDQSSAIAKVGNVNWAGVTAHQADKAHSTGITGAGTKVCVLSDGVDTLAARIASGDIGPTAVLPLQAGSGDEGTAMLEIVHDMAPNATLGFASAFPSSVQFATNIGNLRTMGLCDVIVDDVGYFNEAAFQDGPIAQAINAVTTAGAIYLSSAGNSGSVTHGTSATIEADFVTGGPLPPVISAVEGTATSPVLHAFAGLSYATLTAPTDTVTLKWSDPLGSSTNDYDLFVLDTTGTSILGASIDSQGPGAGDDPVEIVQCDTPNCFFPAGARIYVVKYSGVARALHIDVVYGRITGGTSGSTAGHNAAASVITVGAVDVRIAGGSSFVGGASNPVTFYSSDGPRRLFFNPNGTSITPGNVFFNSNGGTLLQKVNLAASDCGATTTPGFATFCGTSAAAPTAAAIAALVRSARPGATKAQVTTALLASGLDIEGALVDRDSGVGIVMAPAAVRGVLAPLTLAASFAPAAVPVGGTSVLTIPVTNPNAIPLLGVTMANTYPVSMVNAAAPGLLVSGTGCVGSGTAIAGANNFSVTMNLPPNTTCTLTISVKVNSAGPFVNTTGTFATPIAMNTVGAPATLTTGVAPGQPVNPAITAGFGLVTVAFQAPGNNGGLPITGFVATCTPVGGGTPVTGSGSASPVTVGGLAAATSYTCTVAAVNGAGAGGSSVASNVATPGDPVGDIDNDNIPNAVEVVEGRNPVVKDNDVFGNGRLFAMQQYRDFLGREGDAGGITFYTTMLNGNPALRAPVIESFFLSPEFSGVVAPVTRLYFAFFGRTPDYPGLQFQVNAYRTGTPLAAIANNFSLSPEFIATYGSLNNTQYVTLLYQNVLGRAPVQAEIDFYVNQLVGGTSRGQAMLFFSESPEYQALKFNAVYVTNMYVGMLRRSPEQGGLDFWVAYMAAGNSGQALIAGFLNAPEYHNRFLP